MKRPLGRLTVPRLQRIASLAREQRRHRAYVQTRQAGRCPSTPELDDWVSDPPRPGEKVALMAEASVGTCHCGRCIEVRLPRGRAA